MTVLAAKATATASTAYDAWPTSVKLHISNTATQQDATRMAARYRAVWSVEKMIRAGSQAPRATI